MKYNIFGFNQKKAVELGLNMNDLAVLRDYIDFTATGGTATHTEGNIVFHWVKYENVLEQLPILTVNTKEMIARIYKKLSRIGMLMHKTIRNEAGTFSFYAPGNNLKSLVYNSANDSQVRPLSPTGKTPYDPQVRTKDNSIKQDNSIKNNTEMLPTAAAPVKPKKTVNKPALSPEQERLYNELYDTFHEKEQKRTGQQTVYTHYAKERAHCKNLAKWMDTHGITVSQFFKAFEKCRKQQGWLFNEIYQPTKIIQAKYDDIRKHITPEKDLNDWSGYHAEFC